MPDVGIDACTLADADTFVFTELALLLLVGGCGSPIVPVLLSTLSVAICPHPDSEKHDAAGDDVRVWLSRRLYSLQF